MYRERERGRERESCHFGLNPTKHNAYWCYQILRLRLPMFYNEYIYIFDILILDLKPLYIQYKKTETRHVGSLELWQHHSGRWLRKTQSLDLPTSAAWPQPLPDAWWSLVQWILHCETHHWDLPKPNVRHSGSRIHVQQPHPLPGSR